MKLLLLLSVGLGLTWALQDFHPEQVILWGPHVSSYFSQVSITLQNRDGNSQQRGPKDHST